MYYLVVVIIYFIIGILSVKAHEWLVLDFVGKSYCNDDEMKMVWFWPVCLPIVIINSIIEKILDSID